MQSLLVTALMGLFVLSGGAMDASASTTAAISALPSYSVSITAYNAVPEQTDSDPTITASGAYSNPSIVAARSVDLASELPFGTVIDIEPSATSSNTCGYSVVQNQIGLRVIADSMNPKMHNKVDVLLKDHSAATTLGLCSNFVVHVVGHVDVQHMPKNQAELAQMLSSGAVAVAR